MTSQQNGGIDCQHGAFHETVCAANNVLLGGGLDKLAESDFGTQFLARNFRQAMASQRPTAEDRERLTWQTERRSAVIATPVSFAGLGRPNCHWICNLQSNF